jgi:DNA adenine methylase
MTELAKSVCETIPSFSRIGSKFKLRKKIIKYFPPDDEWRTFVEPFAGSAQIFKALHKNPEKIYVLNDLNKDIYNIWKNIKSVDIDKIRRFDFKGDIETFHHLRDNYKPKTKEQELYKDLYLSRFSYANQRVSYAKKNQSKFRFLECLPNIQAILKNVVVSNLDYLKVLKKYNQEDTLFYLDPPYFEKEHLYENQSVNPIELANALKKIKGKFILSYNDVPEVVDAFKGFHIHQISTTYSIFHTADKTQEKRQVKELLITNYI